MINHQEEPSQFRMTDKVRRRVRSVAIAAVGAVLIGVVVKVLVPRLVRPYLLLLAAAALIGIRSYLFQGQAGGGVPFSKTRHAVDFALIFFCNYSISLNSF